MSARRRPPIAASLILAVALTSAAHGQTAFYNLDAGRPNRVEDAIPTERWALDLQLAPLRIERLLDGSYRWRSDPKLSVGFLPFTELEVRAPYLLLRPRSGEANAGFTTLGVGLLRALAVESLHRPAIALSGEALLPIGNLAPPRTSYAIKLLATKTSRFGRAHINVAAGTYSVRPGPPPDTSCSRVSRLLGLDGCGTNFIPDLPCSVAHGSSATSLAAQALCMPPVASGTSAEAADTAAPRLYGSRWLAGVGLDHTFAMHALLIGADLVVERFQGLTTTSDMTAELGVRRQLTPQLMIDLGAARRFAGAVPSSSVTFGLTYAMAVRRAGAGRLAPTEQR